MNKSILIVICDFLLVSLLAFSTVDINKVADNGAPRSMSMQMNMMTNAAPESGRDLAAVMKSALEQERKQKDLLMGELSHARATTGERERQTAALQEQIETRDRETQRLQSEYASARTNLQALSQQLQSTSTESQASREKLTAMEADMRKQVDQAAQLQKQLADLSLSNQAAMNEKMKLAGQLQVAEAEKRAAADQVVHLREDVKAERAERIKLAEGVQTLASKSSELTQEIRDNRPLTPNTIFNEFMTNRVEAQLAASKPGLFNDATNYKTSETILVSDGKQTFALCHVDDTPLRLWIPGTDWNKVTGTLQHDTTQVPARVMSFHAQDPRVVFIPVSAAEVQQLGTKVYRISPDPFKFQDAVLVGTTEGYYGECRFEIDVTTPDYVKLDRSVLKGLFGKFNPSRGDLVFSKTGELLGIMANSTYCLMLRTFDAAATFQLGEDLRPVHTGAVLARLYAAVNQMPLRLQ